MKNTLRLALIVLMAASLTLRAAAQSDAVIAEAQAALGKNDLAAAETLLTPLTTGENPDAAACHELGQVRLRQGRAEDAIALLEKATSLAPTNADYFASLGMGIGRRMSQVSFMQQALLSTKLKKAFAKAVELDPNHIGGLIGLTRYYLNAPEIAGGSIEKAREFAARVKQRAPMLGELELGGIAEHEEDYATAAAHYEAAAQVAPQNAPARLAAARMLAKLDRKTEARDHLEAILQLTPTHRAAQKALAEL